jgi:hypothetical protein
MSIVTLLLTVSYGEQVLYEREVLAGVTFSLDASSVAKQLGVPQRCISFDTGGVELERVGSEFVTPPLWRQLASSAKYALPVNVGAFLTEEGLHPESWYESDEMDEDDEDSDCEAKKNVSAHDDIVFEDGSMQERYNYLKHGTYPERIVADLRKNFRRECKRSYSISSDGHLMFNGNLRRPDRVKKHACRAFSSRYSGQRMVVPTKADMLTIVDERHQRSHNSRERLENGLNMFYFYHNMGEVIAENRANCTLCDESQKVPKTTQAILSTMKYEIVMIDLFFLPMNGADGEVCVLLMKDHFTKFHWAKEFKGKHMGPVAEYILQIFADGQVPERIHCDNGNEFVNQCMNEVLSSCTALDWKNIIRY